MVQYSPFVYKVYIVVVRGSPFIYRENISIVKYSPSIKRENISEGKLLVGLFILVVAVGGEDKDDDFGVVDFVYEAVLLCDAAAPLACAVARQRFGMAGAGTGVVAELGNELQCLLICFWLGFIQLL